MQGWPRCPRAAARPGDLPDRRSGGPVGAQMNLIDEVLSFIEPIDEQLESQ